MSSSSPPTVVLEAKQVRKTYKHNQRPIEILHGVSCQLYQHQTLGVIGESGCGKSTLAKILMQIEPASDGELFLHGKPYHEIPKAKFRPQIQMIFQDCYSSLNPRKKAIDIVAEPLLVNSGLSKQECRQRARAVMAQVGLLAEHHHRYPHMFSGGQRQRIGIARAIITKPAIIICDEPVSALDLSVQAQIINLLLELQQTYRLSYLFVSHDLAVVNHISDQILVLYFGSVVEYGAARELFDTPKHPYTKALLASIDTGGGGDKDKFYLLEGELPSPYNPPTGCAFHTRCPLAQDICKHSTPKLRQHQGRLVACHLIA
ncbi:MAG: ATP-binding cassette domain-containing protein [Pseudomonadota bacterium]|nr:ATP-binding cassette domain-containing protein [Pseudomonadota bacterium]